MLTDEENDNPVFTYFYSKWTNSAQLRSFITELKCIAIALLEFTSNRDNCTALYFTWLTLWRGLSPSVWWSGCIFSTETPRSGRRWILTESPATWWATLTTSSPSHCRQSRSLCWARSRRPWCWRWAPWQTSCGPRQCPLLQSAGRHLQQMFRHCTEH